MSSLSTAIVLLFMNTSGLLVHYTVFHKVVFKSLFGRIFGKLWLSREIAYLIQATCFLSSVVPGLMMFADLDKTPLYLKYLSQLIIMFAYISIFANFLIAVNRCCIVYTPLKYKTIFSRERTNSLVATSWILALFPCVPSMIRECLDVSVFPFGITEKDVQQLERENEYIKVLCGRSRELLDVSVATSFYAVTFIVDLFTYRKVLIVLKERRNLNLAGPTKTELRLCKMIVAQQLVSITTAATFNMAYFFGPIWPSREHFTLITWSANAMLDGVVVVLFTPKFFKSRSCSISMPNKEVRPVQNVDNKVY
ncbi:hypothetical protein QR680_007124 [Steinernema hermaphroditum]|uniref:G-protein coupled receptors family 1 profile domain-containing protein n=1 Tax=Steinernema hermaphroditum TaxID=289476 RepID=A0AA39HXP3_9BILA|nr:hypothetical protein QR680_007124 [Steinernema hermaphroditum]